VSNARADWGEPVAQGTLKRSLDEQRISFEPVTARYVRLVIKSGYDDGLSAIAELNLVSE
jgi:hypothetical protein